MKDRRDFLKLASAALPAVAAVAVSTGVARADDAGGGPFVGSWTTVHELPPGLPAPNFREFLTIAAGGVLQETNSFLNAQSALTLPGLPPLNASDGFGNWKNAPGNAIAVRFRKLVFNALTHLYIGDFHVEGRLFFVAGNLTADWSMIQLELLGGPVIDLTGGVPAHSTGGVEI
jgi:hypothetical protein